MRATICGGILESSRGYIRGYQVAVDNTDEIPSIERIDGFPTHTLLKRNPDRSWSPGFRNISDLRRANLRMGLRDVFPTWAQGVSDILPIVLELKSRFSWRKGRLATGHFPDAFKQVLVRPDCGRVFTHQLAGGLGVGWGISRYLDPPYHSGV